MKCPACNKPQRNIGIGPRALWHCDHCEMADTEPLTAPSLSVPRGMIITYKGPPPKWHLTLREQGRKPK